jgi:hypothetical protein
MLLGNARPLRPAQQKAARNILPTPRRGVPWEQKLRLPSERPAYAGTPTVGEIEYATVHPGQAFGFYILDEELGIGHHRLSTCTVRVESCMARVLVFYRAVLGSLPDKLLASFTHYCANNEDPGKPSPERLLEARNGRLSWITDKRDTLRELERVES